jgi:hypothetical protein
MKTPTFHNSHPRRLAAESQGIALMLSGSYVLRNLNQDELDALQRIKHSALKFSDDVSVVVTNAESKSQRGRLARLAFLSSDGQFAKYRHPQFPSRSSVISLRLIKATAHSPRDFVASLKGNETLQIRRQHDAKAWFGILFGSDSHVYSSLVVAAPTSVGFDFIDIETQPNPYNSQMIVSVLQRNPLGGQSARATTFGKYGLS